MFLSGCVGAEDGDCILESSYMEVDVDQGVGSRCYLDLDFWWVLMQQREVATGMGKGRADIISCGWPGYNLNIRVLKLGNMNVNGIVNGRSLFTSADAISESVSGGLQMGMRYGRWAVRVVV